MLEKFKTILQYAICATGAMIFIYTLWHFGSKWNYSISYEDRVRQTVCEMVDQQYLKGKCDE